MKASRSGLAVKMSAICWLARSAWSLVKTGQPSISVQPFWPVSRSIPFVAAGGVAEARGAGVDVVGRDVAELQADRAALGLQLHRLLGHLDAHQVVVGAEIGLAQVAVGLEEIGVDRHHRHRRRDLAACGSPWPARSTARSRWRRRPSVSRSSTICTSPASSALTRPGRCRGTCIPSRRSRTSTSGSRG